MPFYRYRNLTTGETFEIEQRMIEPALATDPKTGDPVKRLIQPVGIAFKGSGFYVTDSRSSTKRSSTPADAKGATEGGGAEMKGATEAKSSEGPASSDAPARKDSPAKESTSAPKAAPTPTKSASSGGASD